MFRQLPDRIPAFLNSGHRKPYARPQVCGSPGQPQELAHVGNLKTLLVIFLSSVFALACTAQSKDLKSTELKNDKPPAPEQRQLLSAKESLSPLHALEEYKGTLRSRGELLENQGILIESLDG